MARIIVIGGGLGGLASSARLAKIGHQVTLLEQSTRLGGALRPIQADGFTWEGGPSSTLLPAVLRDLFRKSGRPLDRELELQAQETVRTHRFPDGTLARLPGGSRAAQIRALNDLTPGLGDQWVEYVAGFAEDWEILRKELIEVPWRPDASSPALTARIRSRDSLARRLARELPDHRLRQIASHPFLSAGQDPRHVPAWAGLTAYLEQRFGSWTVTGGMTALVGALEARLRTRRVHVELGMAAQDVDVHAGGPVVRTGSGDLDADLVVCAIDPRRLPVLAGLVRRTRPASPPDVSHLGIEGDVPELLGSGELVLHGEPTLWCHGAGSAPEGATAVTVLHRGLGSHDVLDVLAQRGVDLRGRVLSRLDRSAAELAAHGSPYGVRWAGRTTLRHRQGPTTPIPGILTAGAHASPFAGLPFVGLSGSLVAQTIGPA